MTTFRKIALYGAGGQYLGKVIIDTLLESGIFDLTVLARQSSTATYPTAIKVARVPNDLSHAELVTALKGQDIVISLVGTDGIASQTKVIDAAVEAGVKRFVPSEWGFDNADPVLVQLSPVFAPKNKIQKYLEAKVQAHPDFSWHAVANSIWLDLGLHIGFIDIDPKTHSVSYWDGGSSRASHTSLSYVAKGVVETLKHPTETKNRRIFISGFVASQREIVAELERQQGVSYTVKNPIVGEQAIKQAHDQWIASGETDWYAAFRTVAATILMEQFGSNFEETQKGSLLTEFAQMPQLTLEGLVRDFLAKFDGQ